MKAAQAVSPKRITWIFIRPPHRGFPRGLSSGNRGQCRQSGMQSLHDGFFIRQRSLPWRACPFRFPESGEQARWKLLLNYPGRQRFGTGTTAPTWSTRAMFTLDQAPMITGGSRSYQMDGKGREPKIASRIWFARYPAPARPAGTASGYWIFS